MRNAASHIYKSIPNMRFEYRIGDMADVQRKMPNGEWQTIKPFMSKHNKVLYINLWFTDTLRKPIPVIRLMDTYFFDGYARKNHLNITHKNHVRTDCSVYNLVFVDDVQLRNMYKANKRVVKVDRNGQAVEYYKSCAEAAKRNFISKTAVHNRCTNKLQNPWLLDGYNYQFVEDDND